MAKKIESFWDRCTPEPNTGCWFWTGSLFKSGYGSLATPMVKGIRKSIYAHRTAWELSFGKIPEGLFVCHKCDMRSCINPNHLFLGTIQDNTRDCISKGRNSFGERHTSTKISDATCEKIREEYAKGGTSQSILAAIYGISQQQISQIVTFKRRRRVTTTIPNRWQK